jgi:hypothetical protein
VPDKLQLDSLDERGYDFTALLFVERDDLLADGGNV